MRNQLLLESAPLALEQSRMLCSWDKCSWYHGPWQYLRLLGIMVSSQEHEQFYSKELSCLSETGQFDNVLISGTTDYAMTEIIHKSYSAFPDLTVVDRCETPLFLNRWYAKKFSLPLKTERADILRYTSNKSFDVICTHCFLGYFSEEMLPALINHWRKLLRKGGKLVTINRIRPGMSGQLRFSEEQSALFIERAMATDWEKLGLEQSQVFEWVRNFAEQFSVYPVHSLDMLVKLFETNGFKAETILTEGQHNSSTAPSTTGEAQRCYLVLRAE